MANNYEGKYQNFMFMAGWRDMLEGMEQDFGIDYAKEALWNLMLVGTLEGQEPISDKQSIVGFVKGCIQPVVKTSTANYNKNKENGSKGGRPKIEVDVAEAIRLHDEEGLTWKLAAKKLGISEDTLREARKAYAQAEKPKNPEIEPEKLEDEKMEKPKNPPVFSNDDKIVRKTEKPNNGVEVNGFRF